MLPWISSLRVGPWKEAVEYPSSYIFMDETNNEVPEAERNLIQKAISQTFQSTAHLANLLPTGTFLAFQLLSPIFTNIGNCDSIGSETTKGTSVMGLPPSGLWIIDGSTTLPRRLAAKYNLRFIDFMHAVMSDLVFALFDQNVVNCFFPAPSNETQEILTALPVGIGVLRSMFFVAFPTQRHGIGFPLSKT
ncbi:hypothetical protein VNO77_06434 [Canavalia gladiata]|uniref:Uncharacterized protein n=1 Tax=Canavalia gladiata TaxID=3824 RepID=A0AAN9QSX4_CANGL